MLSIAYQLPSSRTCVTAPNLKKKRKRIVKSGEMLRTVFTCISLARPTVCGVCHKHTHTPKERERWSYIRATERERNWDDKWLPPTTQHLRIAVENPDPFFFPYFLFFGGGSCFTHVGERVDGWIHVNCSILFCSNKRRQTVASRIDIKK